MSIKIDYNTMSCDLARNIMFEDNPYKDDSSFIGQMLKYGSWNDIEYCRFEFHFLKYIMGNNNGYAHEVLPILDNILQIYDKYFDGSYVDFYNCCDENIGIDVLYRFEYLGLLLNNLKKAPRNYIDLGCQLKKTIEYNINNGTYNSTIIGVSGFDALNKARFRYLSCIGLIHALVHMKILHIGFSNKLSEIFNPYKIYYVSKYLDYLPWQHKDQDSCKFYDNGIVTVEESILDYNACHVYNNFYVSNNKMSVIIAKKFHKDFYNIFDPNTGLVSKERLIDLVNRYNVFALWFNDKSIDECELEILHRESVKVNDCNG